MYVPEQLTIGWIKQAYAKQVLTPKELIEEMIKRAKAQEEKNIWIVPPTEEAIQPYLDALPKEREQYPLWGIPFAIKDNIDLAGVPTTAACPDFSYIPKENATVVEKLIKAGAIPIGKTNLDQFATGLVGTRSPYGEVHNAYQPEMISGGSSSGSAVSVALGLAAFALGTDTAGSGRVPAMLNTLVGWKPPVGSWSSKGVVPACASLDCVTVFAKKWRMWSLSIPLQRVLMQSVVGRKCFRKRERHCQRRFIYQRKNRNFTEISRRYTDRNGMPASNESKGLEF